MSFSCVNPKETIIDFVLSARNKLVFSRIMYEIYRNVLTSNVQERKDTRFASAVTAAIKFKTKLGKSCFAPLIILLPWLLQEVLSEIEIDAV